jgi:hypothetical protein
MSRSLQDASPDEHWVAPANFRDLARFHCADAGRLLPLYLVDEAELKLDRHRTNNWIVILSWR